MHVIRIQRGKGTYVREFPDTVLRADDRLLLTDTPENLKRYEVALGGTLYSGDVEVDDEHPLTAEDQQISEIVVVDGLDRSRARRSSSCSSSTATSSSCSRCTAPARRS